MEILYLEQNIIEKFNSSEAENVLNCVITLLHDKTIQIKDFCEELKRKVNLNAARFFFIKKVSLQAMLESGVEQLVAYRILEQFENYRCYLFKPVASPDDKELIEAIVVKFHENSEIGGFFLDPSEENSIAFLK